MLRKGGPAISSSSQTGMYPPLIDTGQFVSYFATAGSGQIKPKREPEAITP